ncbi:hypothetical protein [Aquipseudomonas alcaligenes]|uniref:hypothetical protein n=1 Tax=Aquipseudomonas alcaligenes TaxID=43263 RepID=UPI0011155010|nr:hypothetical protein [Pseudomonas alcaligenes]
MAGRFEIPSILGNLGSLTSSTLQSPGPLFPDNRSRAERREDFERKLKALDKNSIEALRDRVRDSNDPDELAAMKEDIQNSLTKLIIFYDNFESLNSEESRKVSLKERELKLEARYDWREKSRLFLFRILGSALVVVTLFFIGYVEHEYEWARLPMTKYLNTSTTLP